MTGRVRHRIPWAGLASGPLAWGLSTQLNYALPDWMCAHGINPVPWIALVLALFALAGGAMSWTSRQGAHDADRFLAGVGALMALLFALVIIAQGAAGFVFTGCER
jgi:hypothetical protein